VWPSHVPAGKGDGGAPSPFEQSADLTGFEVSTAPLGFDICDRALHCVQRAFDLFGDLVMYFVQYWSAGANVVGGTGSDTWYPSWSADGSLYTTWTDGEY
jgi:hypothetical protein